MKKNVNSVMLRIAAASPASRSLSPTTKIDPATIQPRAIMLPVINPATVRGSSAALARARMADPISRWTIQPNAAPAQPSSGRPAATKIGSARARTQRSRYRNMRSGMGSDAFRACVVKGVSGTNDGRAASNCSFRGPGNLHQRGTL